mgnify:CR=1 FL=1
MKDETILKYQHLRFQKNLGRLLLKYTPYQVTLVFVIFCIWRGLGHERLYLAMALGSMGFMWMPYVLVSSVAGGFCIRHRLLIMYDFLVGVLIYSEIWWGFGVWRRPLNWLCAVIGIVLLSDIFIRSIRKKKLCKTCKMTTVSSLLCGSSRSSTT